MTTKIKIHRGQSWGEKGFGRIQRGNGGSGSGGDQDMVFECGLGCISYYTFLPVGGVSSIESSILIPKIDSFFDV